MLLAVVALGAGCATSLTEAPDDERDVLREQLAGQLGPLLARYIAEDPALTEEQRRMLLRAIGASLALSGWITVETADTPEAVSALLIARLEDVSERATIQATADARAMARSRPAGETRVSDQQLIALVTDEAIRYLTGER